MKRCMLAQHKCLFRKKTNKQVNTEDISELDKSWRITDRDVVLVSKSVIKGSF